MLLAYFAVGGAPVRRLKAIMSAIEVSLLYIILEPVNFLGLRRRSAKGISIKLETISPLGTKQ